MTKDILSRATIDIHKSGDKNFIADQTVVVTYISAFKDYRKNNTFQGIIVSNGNRTYVIALYLRLEEANAITGYGETTCNMKVFRRCYSANSLQGHQM